MKCPRERDAESLYPNSAKVGKYSELHIRTDVRNKRVLDFRDEKLKQARETLVSQTGALVGHSK